MTRNIRGQTTQEKKGQTGTESRSVGGRGRHVATQMLGAVLTPTDLVSTLVNTSHFAGFLRGFLSRAFSGFRGRLVPRFVKAVDDRYHSDRYELTVSRDRE